MKKITYILLAASAIAVAVSCNKEVDQVIPENNGKVTILTAYADNGIVSKTTLDGVNVVWSASDVITAFDAAGKCYNSTETQILENGSIAKFSVPTEEPLFAVYPAYEEGEEVEMADGKITATIPTRQNAINNTFDNGANVEVAKITDKDNIKFKNVGGLVAVKVKGTTHNIVSIKIADAGGVYNMTGTITAGFDNDGNVVVDDIATGESYVDLTGNITAGETYYAVVAPGIYEGVTITFTDEDGKTATYTKKTSLEVERNSNQLIGGFDIPESKWQTAEKYYVKVTSASDLTDGAYLIVYEEGALAFNGGLSSLDATKNTIAVEINDAEILSTETVDAARFVITKDEDYYFIQAGNGSYIGRSTNSNGMDISNIGLANSITITDEDALIATAAKMHLRYNKTSGQERFRYFKDNATSGEPTQEPVALYKYNGPFVIKQSADLSFGETEFEITVGELFTAPTLNNPHSLTVTYESDNEQVAEVDEATGAISLTGTTGTAKITASFEGNETFYAGSAFYSITVKAAPVVMQTLAELKEFSEATEQETEINFNDVLVTWTNGTRAYIEDETSGMYVYGGVTSDLKTGDVLNGLTKVKIKVYNGQNEITGVTGTALYALKTGTATVTATTLTVAQAISEQGLVDYENMRVEINNASVAVNGTKKYLSDGNGNQIQLYTLSGSGASIADLNAGDEISSAVGYPVNYKSGSTSTPEFIIVSTDDLVVKKAPVISVTGIPTDNISADGDEITVNYSVENPVSGVTVNPSANVSWINSFEIGTGTISFTVDANSGEESEERTGKVTVAYTGATSVTFDIIQNGNKQNTKQYYVKVTTAPSDWTTGSYLIVNEEASVALTGSGTTAAEVKAPTEVVISNGRIEATDDVKALAIQIVVCTESDAETDYLLQAGEKYFYNTSSTANGFSYNTISYAKKYAITLAIDDDNNATITAAGSYLRYNPTNNTGAIFNFYKATTYTSQKPIQLYRLDN